MRRILATLTGLILSGTPVHGQESPTPSAERSTLYAMMDAQAPFASIKATAMTNQPVAGAPTKDTTTNAVARPPQTEDTNAPTMNYYEGSWHYTFANDPATRGQFVATANHLENVRLDGVVGTIDVGGKSFEVTKGMPDFSEDFASMPDASRASLREEMNRRVQVGGGFYFSESDKFGYQLSKNATVSTTGFGKVKLSMALPTSWHQ